ncbi:MAG: hypothetical protein M0Q95_19630 [Porticoccaceae bacterium]|nr:hypothetical protein [Porticoccaceae bacterium]
MNSNQSSGGKELIRSVCTSGAGTIALDGAEMALDSMLDDGLLRDIPIFGWVVKIYGAYQGIKERIFLKKICRFLGAAQKTTEDERRLFLARMEADPDHQKKVGEGVLLLIDRHEDSGKSELLGRVFASYIKDEITYEEFQRYAFIIDKLFLKDLVDLGQYYTKLGDFEESRKRGDKVRLGQFLEEMTIQTLLGIGLLDSEGYIETKFSRNERGDKLISILKGK